MEGGTTFHFVTGGIHEALRRAKEAAGDKDVRIGGAVATIRQYLEARLVDEMHLAISPVLLGSGEHPLAGLDLTALRYRVAEQAPSPTAMHVAIGRRPPPLSRPGRYPADAFRHQGACSGAPCAGGR